MTKPGRVLIAGGGLAGMAAAVSLATVGVPVLVLETRKKLGGRATSFEDVRSGEVLDNCQHVVLGCCTNYLHFLKTVGTADRIRWTREQYWIERGGRTSVIRPSILPAPLHFSFSVLAARFLTISEKLALGTAMRHLLRVDRSAWRQRTFIEFLRQHRQSARLIEKFWAPVVVSACNLAVEKVCASAAMQVFQEGFLAHPNAADVGVSAVPLIDLYANAEGIIRSSGGEVRLGSGVERLSGTSVTTTAGETLHADRVICALPPERAADVVDPEIAAADPRFQTMGRITHSPILGVHLIFDRPVLTLPHCVFVDGGVQWLFRKDDQGRAVHAVISGADDWMGLSEEEIGGRVATEMRAYLPGTGGAGLERVRAVKEKRATFALTPSSEELRPATLPDSWRSSEPPIVLAGDAMQTGWPATMEGAVRSGYAAAAATLSRQAGEVLVPDMRPAALARLLGLRQTPSPLIRVNAKNDSGPVAPLNVAMSTGG